jgi:DNA-binding NtrC family response regulator
MLSKANAHTILNRRMSHVLLASVDWQSRALLRAQLIEEGVGVEAYENVREAVRSLALGPTPPPLFVADISLSDDPSADVELLSTWSGRVPIWIIASRGFIVEKGLKRQGFEMIFLRPVDMGELVEQIKQRVETK